MTGNGHNSLGGFLDLVDPAHLVGSLVSRDLAKDETTLGVVQQAEVLLGLLQADNIHKSRRELGISADLAINLDQTLNEDGLGLLVVESVFEAVTEHDDEREAFPQLVRTSGRTRSPDTGKLVEHPVRRRSDALHMTLGSASHLVWLLLFIIR